MKMDLHFPYQEMYEEASSLMSEFVMHRKYDGHRGWKSIAIHGIRGHSGMTESFREYGIEDDAEYDWTEIVDRCPKTKEFLEGLSLYTSYARVRFMLLDPSGYISPHRDYQLQELRFINFALNNPEGCKFVIEEHGTVPFQAGEAYLLDVSNIHAVWNNSEEPRIHMIIHGTFDQKELEAQLLAGYQNGNYG